MLIINVQGRCRLLGLRCKRSAPLTCIPTGSMVRPSAHIPRWLNELCCSLCIEGSSCRSPLRSPFAGTLPSSWSALRNLSSLYLMSNNLTGSSSMPAAALASRFSALYHLPATSVLISVALFKMCRHTSVFMVCSKKPEYAWPILQQSVWCVTKSTNDLTSQDVSMSWLFTSITLALSANCGCLQELCRPRGLRSQIWRSYNYSLISCQARVSNHRWHDT